MDGWWLIHSTATTATASEKQTVLATIVAESSISLTSTNPPPSNKLTPVQEFDKGTKQDSGAFPVLKDERFWDDFIRSTKAIARSQRVDNVLDSTYVPITTDEIELFDHQQAYMYTVIQLTMQTDKGQELVCDYEDTYNAQKVHADITPYHATSTKATNQASELLTHITSNRLGLDTWPSTTEAYTMHWQDTIRKYHKLVPTAQKIAPEQQMSDIASERRVLRYRIACS
jgi:hypothetical protein